MKIAADVFFPESEWEDLITSLVRQWQTYDNRATLFADENRQIYLTACDNPRVNSTAPWNGKKSAGPRLFATGRSIPPTCRTFFTV